MQSWTKRDASRVEPFARIRRVDFRGRLLRGSDLEWSPPACALCDEHDGRRDPHRFVLEIDSTDVASRIYRRRLGHVLAPARPQDRRRPRRARADSAGRIHCSAHFIERVLKLTRSLHAKLETLVQAFDEHFGTQRNLTIRREASFSRSSCRTRWIRSPFTCRRSRPVSRSIAQM